MPSILPERYADNSKLHFRTHKCIRQEYNDPFLTPLFRKRYDYTG